MAKRIGWYRAEQLILKITLMGSRPAIWRRVEVHSGLTLYELHFVIQNLFEWNNSHLFQFLVTEGDKITNAALARAERYSMNPEDPIFSFDQPDRPADQQLVGRIFTPEHQQIIYEYDFGDSWYHLVKLEKRTPGGAQDHIPVCLAGKNSAPYDDMGGIGGYYMKLAAYADEADEDHELAREWLGDDFQPPPFDLEKINKRLAAVFRPATKKPRKRKKSE